MTGVLGAPMPAPPGQWPAALVHAVSAADDASALDELVPDLWAEPNLSPADHSEEPEGTTSDATVPDLSIPGADNGPGAEIGDPFGTDPTDNDSPDDRDDGYGPVSW